MAQRRVLSWLLLVLLAPTIVRAQTDPVDEFIRAQMRAQNIPGLSMVVLRRGEVIKAEGYGLADIKRNVAATPETVYKIASVSKQFVAAGIMLLVQERRIALADPIGKYLPEAPAAWSGITIRHLLTHTSGLGREAPGFDGSRLQSDADLLRTAYPLPLRFAPGGKWEYSNLGYFALAEIMTRVTGRPWTDHVADRIFTPLGMTSTYPTNTNAVMPKRAQGYVDNDALRDANEWPALRPSGAFLSTVLDLAKWDAALHSDRILADSTRRAMWAPVTLDDGRTAPYGFGWMLGNIKGHRLVHHSGGMPGARASFARFVDEGLTIIVLMNLDDVDIDEIVHGVANIYLPSRAPLRQ